MATLAIAAIVAVLVLVLPLYIVYKPPSPLIRYFSHRWTDVIWRLWLPPSKKLVALTIDDAPSDHTRDILAALAASSAHATFFVVGNQVPGREHILRDIVLAGHELGNHGMRDEPARSLSDDELKKQIKLVEGIINDAYHAAGRARMPPNDDVEVDEGEVGTGMSSRRRRNHYYRPGSGFFSDRMRVLVRKLDYRLVLGSIYPHDAQIGNWRVNAKHILSMLSPGGIIICHDRRSWTPPMLQKVLPEMSRRGYKAVTVTELLDEATG
ncbi:hypothetical protein B0H63DRAFT_444237 [Podospora didyma]|uniref:chitin deacetylase n=1 Tax=Podospora didyma TaxID=330526 RepID=A0AAE0P5X6_9PEZI|nr:hypothetical protein B0H63DRAFT_444237 [Podospora didyma]